MCVDSDDADDTSWIESSLSDDDTVGALSSAEEGGYVGHGDEDFLQPEVLDYLLDVFPEA